MKIELLPHNAIKIFGHDRSLCFSLLSSDHVRICEEEAPQSVAIRKMAASLPLHAKVGKDRAVLSSAEIKIIVSPSLSVSIIFRGRTVFEGIPLFKKEGGSFSISDQGRPVYGLGDKAGPLDKRGYDFDDWNTDDPSAHVDTFKALYKSIPFFILFGPLDSVGVFFDNTSKTHFDICKTDASSISLSWPYSHLDLHLYLGSFKEAVTSFTLSVGALPLPPLWALGNQQSRWSYPSEKEVDRIVAGFKKSDIPLSAVYLDIDYMEGYRDWTVSADRFPDFSDWLARLGEDGIHIVTIIDAGVKADPGYMLYTEGMAKHYFAVEKGRVYHNEVWPGDSVFPSFHQAKVRKWWAGYVASFLALGVSGIWNDMNEPASFKGPFPDDVSFGKGWGNPLAHNVFAHYMNMATADGFALAGKRPFIVTRAAYAGTSAYAAMWTGDNQSIWEHLRLAIPQQLGLSMSGVSFVGTDIGGFGGDTTKELLLRWIEVGAFSPLMRNHSSMGTRAQEPFAFDKETAGIYRKMVMLRYELIPYYYDLLFAHSTLGEPLLRPLVYEFPDDARTYDDVQQFMVGPSLLVSPALFPGVSAKLVSLPVGKWWNYFDGKAYRGGDHVVSCLLGEIPLFVRDHAIIPLYRKGKKTTGYDETLRLLVSEGDASIFHYEDDGESLAYFREKKFNVFSIEHRGENVIVTPTKMGLTTHYRKVDICQPGQKGKTFAVSFIVGVPCILHI